MDKFPTGAGRGLRAICGDPMSWAAEAPELLDVEMEHVARLRDAHNARWGLQVPRGRQVVLRPARLSQRATVLWPAAHCWLIWR